MGKKIINKVTNKKSAKKLIDEDDVISNAERKILFNQDSIHSEKLKKALISQDVSEDNKEEEEYSDATEETEEYEDGVSYDEEDEENDEEDSLDSDDGFEVQSSSDENSENDDSDEGQTDESNKITKRAELINRKWGSSKVGTTENENKLIQQYMNTDDISSDDEENTGNTVGRIPLHWYDAFDHIGFDINGKKISKRLNKDRLDMALADKDDPLASRKIYDMYNDKEVVLSQRELEIIRRIQAGAFAHPEFDDTPDYVDYYTHEKEIMPLHANPDPKRAFLPSKWEMMKVMKIVNAIKEGKYEFKSDLELKRQEEDKPMTYMIWNDEEDDVLAESKKYRFHLPAPKMPLPGHAESYNPPEEYLFTEEELAEYNSQDPEDRKYNFIPKMHNCLRHVAGYKDFVKERFERCLDLYLCPRKLKKRLNIDPESLVPKLPSPKELKPFPNSLCLQYIGHSQAVRSISVSPDGQYLISGSDDGTVRLWEVDTCYCRNTWDLESGPVINVCWNPNVDNHIVTAVAGNKVIFIATGTGDSNTNDITESFISAIQDAAEVSKDNESSLEEKDDDKEEEEISESDGDDQDNQSKNTLKSAKLFNKLAKWKLSKHYLTNKKKNKPSNKLPSQDPNVGPRVEIYFKHPVVHLCWHYKGDYLATLTSSGEGNSLAIHQISKGKTQFPFKKSPGNIQAISFHPTMPFLFVATQQHVKIYHLIEQKMVKKLLSGCKWLSSLDIHPSGDHIIVGSYDRRVVWFDLDLASTPYKTLKFHEKAVRSVQYHRRYPLMASASDDGNVHIFHCMVYSDLMRNPLIVPLKVLKGHGVIGGTGVFSIVFHPRQPWVFSAGADGLINLYQDI